MKKKKMIIGVVIILGMALLPVSSKAVLQANPNTNGTNGKSDSAENWMTNIRKMETKNQAMGLEETIDNTTKKSASGSNGIDVHMIKSTEWGTVAILSTSGYGNNKKMQESTIRSTTGNKSGVYFPLTKWEVVAAGVNLHAVFPNVAPQYFNLYTTKNTSAKVGDALGTETTKNPGCDGWHGATKGWPNSDPDWKMLFRGHSYLFNGAISPGYWGSLGSRAAVVCGEGF